MSGLGYELRARNRQAALLEAIGASEEESLIQDSVEEGSFETDKVKELAKIDLDFFAGLAMPTTFKFGFPPVLKAAWQLLVESLDEEGTNPQIALGIPRGHAKTTLIKLFILYCVLYSNRTFILILAETEKKAVNILSDIEDMLNEPNIMKVYGFWRQGIETDRQDLKKFGFRGRPVILAAIGAGGALRGLNIKNSRPDLMIFDDIQSKECSESQIQSGALERWMIATAMKAKSPIRCMFIFAGNMYPGPNSILKKLKNNPTWVKFISGAILADGTALWPELRSLPSLVQELDNDISLGHPEIFFSEVLNDTEAGVNNRVDLGKIKDWPWREDENPQGKFIVIDPASNKTGGDDVAIGLFEVYDGQPGLRRVIEEKLSPANTIRRTLLFCLKYNVRLVVVESTSYQYTFLFWFNTICQQLGISGIDCVDIYTGNASKNARISDMLKTLTSGDLFLHPEVRNLVAHQIANWNPIKRDNKDGILDLLTYSHKAIELYGNEMITPEAMHISEITAAGVVDDNQLF